jgi:hypothetical protein
LQETSFEAISVSFEVVALPKLAQSASEETVSRLGVALDAPGVESTMSVSIIDSEDILLHGTSFDANYASSGLAALPKTAHTSVSKETVSRTRRRAGRAWSRINHVSGVEWMKLKTYS